MTKTSSRVVYNRSRLRHAHPLALCVDPSDSDGLAVLHLVREPQLCSQECISWSSAYYKCFYVFVFFPCGKMTVENLLSLLLKDDNHSSVMMILYDGEIHSSADTESYMRIRII